MNTSPAAREAHDEALAMIRQGMARPEVLTYLATSAERITGPGHAASILVLDEEGLLRNGASPKLPADYLMAIDRLKPRADLGTCASAAATGQFVLTRDFTADEKWAELRHLPLSLGYTGAWSTPIKSAEGRVLGTFGIYCRDVADPSEDQLAAMRLLAAAAAESLCASAAAR